MTEPDPVPTEPLPGYTPTMYGVAYIDIIADKFTYGLTSSNYSFGNWAYKTSIEDTYIIRDIDTLNAAKYSSFVITHTCNTVNEGDGCCMIKSGLGGVCMIRDASATSMSTYRFTNSQWQAVLSVFLNN